MFIKLYKSGLKYFLFIIFIIMTFLALPSCRKKSSISINCNMAFNLSSINHNDTSILIIDNASDYSHYNSYGLYLAPYSNSFSLQMGITVSPEFVGTYKFGLVNNGAVEATAYGYFYNKSYSFLDSIGYVTITSYNPNLQIISGTFNCTMAYDSSGHISLYDTININNGSFIAHFFRK